MKDQVEAGVAEGRKVGHVAFDGADVKPFPLGHLAITGELARRVIEDRHLCAGRGQDRPLLSTARSQAEHVRAGQRRKPDPRHGDRGGEHDRPLPAPAAATASLLTGIVHGLPAATWRFQASRL